MILRRSRFVHLLPVGPGRTLVVHAISHMRLPADDEISALLDYFSEARRVPEDCEAMVALLAKPGDTQAGLREAIERTVMELTSRRILLPGIIRKGTRTWFATSCKACPGFQYDMSGRDRLFPEEVLPQHIPSVA